MRLTLLWTRTHLAVASPHRIPLCFSVIGKQGTTLCVETQPIKTLVPAVDGRSCLTRPDASAPLSIPNMLSPSLVLSSEQLRTTMPRSALCTAKALLSRGEANGGLLRASSIEVHALLEPFTIRLAQMNTARTAGRVWSGLFGNTHSSDFYSQGHSGSGGHGFGGGRGVAGLGEDDVGAAPGSAFSAEVWTTTGKDKAGGRAFIPRFSCFARIVVINGGSPI